MRCDLHVHSVRSGRVNLPVLRHLANECYMAPAEIYALARSRGMDLVTISDHDTLEGALEIAHLPGVFLSEEVTVHLPSARLLHIGALGITERQHAQIARKRDDAEAFFAYCAAQRIPLVLNHPFSCSIGARAVEDFDYALGRVDLVETHSGGMPDATNLFAREACGAYALSGVGGSDAHAPRSVGRTWTEVVGVSSKEDYLEGLRTSWTVAAGGSGSYVHLTLDALSVALDAYRVALSSATHSVADAARLLALLAAAPALPLVPLLTGIAHLRERRFGAAMYLRWLASTHPRDAGRRAARLPAVVSEMPEVWVG